MGQLPIPTVGRIVLYRGKDGLVRAAIVTHTHGPLCINVHVFGHTAADPEAGVHTSVTHAQPDQEPGCFPSWHWMPYQLQTAGQRHPDALAAASEQIPVNTALTFGAAIQALKAGKKVSRAGWNGKGMWLVLMPALYLPPFKTQGTERKVNDRTAKWIGEDKPLDCQPYIAMWTAQQKWQPGWLASQADMLAEDWCVID
jgi:hypothetical protein